MGTQLHRAHKSIDGVCLATSTVVLGGVAYAALRVGARAFVLFEWGGARELLPHASSVECAPGLLLPLDEARERSWPNWLRACAYGVCVLYGLFGLALASDPLMQAVETIGARAPVREGARARTPTGGALRAPSAFGRLTLSGLSSSGPLLALALADAARARSGARATVAQLAPSAILGANAFGWLGALLVCSRALPRGEVRGLMLPSVLSTVGFVAWPAHAFCAAALCLVSPAVMRVWEAAIVLGCYVLLLLVAWRAQVGDTKRAAAAAVRDARDAHDARAATATAATALAIAIGVGDAGYARLGGRPSAGAGGAKGPAPAGADADASARLATSAVFARLARPPELPRALPPAHAKAAAAPLGGGPRGVERAAVTDVAHALLRLRLDPRVHSARTLALLIAAHALDAQGKSVAARRIEAVRALSGGRRPPAPRLRARARAHAPRALRTCGGVAAEVHFSAEGYAVYETEEAIAVPVLREPAAAHVRETVRVRSSDGSAHAGSDYEPVDAALHFARGQTRSEVHVRIVADLQVEGNETFDLTLYRSRGAAARAASARATGAAGAAGAGPPFEPSDAHAHDGGGEDAAPGQGASSGASPAARTSSPSPPHAGRERVAGARALAPRAGPVVDADGHRMVPVARAQVVITDVAGRGRFVFERTNYRMRESGVATVNVVRVDGFFGPAAVRYKTVGGLHTALACKQEGTLHFGHGELLRSISIELLNTLSVGPRHATFAIVLRAGDGAAERCEVCVVEDPHLPALCVAVRALVPEQAAQLRSVIYLGGGASSRATGGAVARARACCAQWARQLETAVTVFGAGEDFAEMQRREHGRAGNARAGADDDDDDDDDDDGAGAERLLPGPSAADRTLHLLALPWKVLFALAVPPPALLGGWAALAVALCAVCSIGALIGDGAHVLGCCAHVPVEAIAFGVLGGGFVLPDLLASRSAALADAHADVALGGPLCASATHALIGLGLPWLVGAARSRALQPPPSAEWRASVGEALAAAYPDGGVLVVRDADYLARVLAALAGAGLISILVLVVGGGSREHGAQVLGGGGARKAAVDVLFAALLGGVVATAVVYMPR